ncbi:MAG TPA: hypothetical protein VNE39_02520 [Planctomycetota bacterium]|nr:hypothetical protein [Planctomycetota bacterium]
MRNAILCLLIALLLPLRGVAGELPANQWVLVDQQKFGDRLGARVVWDEAAKRLLVLGGELRKSHREEDPPSKNMAFDPATGAWEAWKGELPPSPPTLTIADPIQKLVVELPPELKQFAGEMKPSNSPLADLSPVFLRTRFPRLRGAALVADPLNKQILLLGGFAGGMERGTIGNWTFSLEKGEWRRLKPDTAATSDLREIWEWVCVLQKLVVSDVRSVFYQATSAAYESKVTSESLLLAQTVVLDGLTKLLARQESLGAVAGLGAESQARAMGLAKEAVGLAKAARDGFAAGRLDAPLIAKTEDACWRLDEAADALATEPTPRYAPTVGYDPERKLFVLFGGDHGDYVLADTWLYDPAKRSWRQFWSKAVPEARCGGQMVWLPKAKKLALLGGNTALRKLTYQNFLQPCSPDVWLFDPESGWQLAVKAGDEVKVKTKDNYPLFMNLNPVVCLGDDVLVALSVGGNFYRDYMVSSTWMVRIEPAAAKDAPAEPSPVRLYRSVVPEYNPQWYDAAPRGSRDEVDAMLAAMPANHWVEVPRPPATCGETSWGTALFDPGRDQLTTWSGGHCADPSDAVHTYHVGINRWSIGYIAGGIGKGTLFTGRPDCMNHTYKNFAFDPVTKLVVAPHQAGTHVYDPDARDWTRFTREQPFGYETYVTKCVGTSKGVVAWTGSGLEGTRTQPYFGLFDVKAMKWTALPVKGTLPKVVHGDENGMTWDSKRNVLYLHSAKAYGKFDGEVYRYDFERTAVEPLGPKNKESIGDRIKPRETCYVPPLDMVLFGIGFLNGKQAAYDAAGNRWVRLGIPKASLQALRGADGKWSFDKRSAKNIESHVGSITFSPVWDAKRGVLWAPSCYRSMFVLKLDPKTVEITEAPAD